MKELIRSSAAEYLTFVAAAGSDDEAVEIRYQDQNLWRTQKMMAALYDVDVRTVSEHLGNLFRSTELSQEATIRNFRIVQREGTRSVTRDVQHYSLQAIIAVGFKIENERAVQNKLHWAIHGNTAAEVIIDRADAPGAPQ
jgi:hypothetical protein